MIASLSSSQASSCAAPYGTGIGTWHQFPLGSPSRAFKMTHPSLHIWDIHLRSPLPVGQTEQPEKSGPFSLPLRNCQRRHIAASLSHYLPKKEAAQTGEKNVMKWDVQIIHKYSWVTRTLFRVEKVKRVLFYFMLTPYFQTLTFFVLVLSVDFCITIPQHFFKNNCLFGPYLLETNKICPYSLYM